MTATIIHGNCLDALRTMPDNSVDAIVTDPPYGLSTINPDRVAAAIVRWANGDREFIPAGTGFQGKTWDAFVPPPAVWDECLRVLKPGGHLLCFAGPRTMGLMDLSVRLAGFEIRDSIAWLNGDGFPKGQDLAKSMAKKSDIPAETAAEWAGWNNALKPSFEPVILARKPFTGPLFKNVLEHGVGALNVGATRVGDDQVTINTFDDGAKPFGDAVGEAYTSRTSVGRYPANVIVDESQAAALDEQSGVTKSSGGKSTGKLGQSVYNTYTATDDTVIANNGGLGDVGGASRFFYCAKANKRERPVVDGVQHPTVKPLALIRYLIRLVTPPGGVVLDPFAGSGTTAEAALLEGFRSVVVEQSAEYIPLIEERIRRSTPTA